MVLLEINIGIIGATAIVASLLNTYFKEESNSQKLSAVIACFSVSAALSSIALFMSMVGSIMPLLVLGGINIAIDIDGTNTILTALSVLLFVVATEQLFGLARSRLSETLKKEKAR
ncbi:MAG: hypothetical protein WED04_12130 [Promethearchaeati archaeon SRVP18_Atabeyarchaeia-1]